MKFILKANYFGIHLQRTVTPLEQLSNTLVAVELSVVGMALRIQRTKKKIPPLQATSKPSVGHGVSSFETVSNDLVIFESCRECLKKK